MLEFQFQHQSFNEYSGLISFRMDCLTPNPTFHTRGPPISSEPPSVTSWLNHTKNLQEDFLPPPSPPAASSQHSRQYDPATTHQITSLFCPKPSHHPPPSSHSLHRNRKGLEQFNMELMEVFPGWRCDFYFLYCPDFLTHSQ